MTHHLRLLIVVNFLITASSCNAMMEITGVKNPHYVEFLTNDHVAIQDDNGCNIFDIATNTHIKQISDKRDAHLVVHPKKKKLALSLDTTVTIYDVATDTQKNFTHDKVIISSAFSSSDETIFLHPHYTSQQLIKHNYANDTTFIFLDYVPQKCCRAIACHPKKNELCIACDIGEITTYNQDTCAEIQTIKNIHGDSHKPQRFCKYSPDGLFIVSGGWLSLEIIDSESYTHHILPQTEHLFHSIAFHPNSAVLATIMNASCCIHYYDIRTLELIAQIPELSEFHKNIATSGKISFSPDGTQSIIALLDSCVILPVPFEVIYQTDTKQRLPYLLFLLKNLPLHNTDIIPSLMYTLVETFKR